MHPSHQTATVRAARVAMATRFEMVLHGNRPSWLRSVAEEALDEIEKIDAKLSLYNSSSQIARVNRKAALYPVRVEPQVFDLLQHCKTLWNHTQGAFDITMGPLLQCWGFREGTGEQPSSEAIEKVLPMVGMQHVLLDPDHYTVAFDREGVMLDLGAVGKGYALECATEILRDYEIESAIIHGGTSTVSAIGHPPEDDAWHVAVLRPEKDPAFPHYVGGEQASTDRAPEDVLSILPLIDQSLSVSAVWGKSFQNNNRTFGHVMDGRHGYPSKGNWMAGLICDHTTDTDALSTAMLVDGLKAMPAIQARHPKAMWFIVEEASTECAYKVHAQGITIQDRTT
ncbi:MAG: FAD:protein FMN transferase [Verrucomicrobiota bacterium]|nr:FAD:protein FMN transferase [Verrucomicrobiota bacterium]